MPVTESELDAPPATRLVIRVKLIPQEPPPPPPARQRSSKSALVMILGAVAVVLGWVAISIFRADPAVPPAATNRAPVVSNEPPPKPVEPEVRQQPDPPPSPINQVMPDVPQSALDTIRGTIKVSVRVTLDKQGTVVAAAAEERGSSRYFERRSVEASKKWMFTPANLAEKRTVLVKFSFTRDGVTVHANPTP